MKSKRLIFALIVIAAVPSFAAGIFTLRGKLQSFTDTEIKIQTSTMIYEIKKSGLSQTQLAEIKAKKVGEAVDLVVSTESVASVRDAKSY